MSLLRKLLNHAHRKAELTRRPVGELHEAVGPNGEQYRIGIDASGAPGDYSVATLIHLESDGTMTVLHTERR